MSGKTSKSSTENGSVKKRGSTLQKVCLFGAAQKSLVTTRKKRGRFLKRIYGSMSKKHKTKKLVTTRKKQGGSCGKKRVKRRA